MRTDAAPYSYRSDATVPGFVDDRPILVFDGACILCAASVKFLLRHDRDQRFRFVIAQSPLGQALYRHYRLDPVEFQTNLVIIEGRVYSKLDAVSAALRVCGGMWSVAAWMRFIPQPLSDWGYDLVAKNRYRLFGRSDHCMMPTPDIRARFIET